MWKIIFCVLVVGTGNLRGSSSKELDKKLQYLQQESNNNSEIIEELKGDLNVIMKALVREDNRIHYFVDRFTMYSSNLFERMSRIELICQSLIEKNNALVDLLYQVNPLAFQQQGLYSNNEQLQDDKTNN